MTRAEHRVATPLLAVALTCAGSFAAELAAPSASTLTGTISGSGSAGVWLGAVGEDVGEATWTLVDGGRFEVPAPSGEQAVLVAVAKDRVPLAMAVPASARGEELELALSPGLTLAGTVRSNDGRLLGGVGIRVAAADDIVLDTLAWTGFAISLREARMRVPLGDGRAVDVPPFARSSWRSSSDGTFRIGGLAPGRHFIEATMPGFVPDFRSHVGIREDTDNRVELELFEAAYVTGHVFDGDGAPVAGAAIRADWQAPLRPVAERDSRLDGHRHVRRRAASRTGEDGSFLLGPLDSGPVVTVFAESPESGSSRRLAIQAPYDGLAVEVGHHVVRGRVVDAATGEPLKSFEVSQVAPSENLRRPYSPAFGDGRFEMRVTPDTHLIQVDAPGRFPWVTRLFASAVGEYDLGEVRLAGTRSITGRVRDAASGEPVSGARVHRSLRPYEDRYVRLSVSEGARTPRGAETGPDGTFVLGGLPSGADLLEVSVSQGGGFGRTVDLPPGVRHLEIVLAFDGTVSGSLELPDGTPAQGTVRLWERLGESWTSTGWQTTRWVGDDGTFRWHGLGDGEYRVTAQSDAGVVANPSRTFSLLNGAPVNDIHLVVEPAGRVRGTIIGLRRGESVWFEVRNRNGQFVRQQQLGQGSFLVEGVPDGASIAVAASDGGTFQRTVDLDEQYEARFDFDFSESARLTGTVRAGGRPVGGIRLAVVPEDRSRPTAYATTGERGRYSVQGIARGAHSVRTRAGHSFDVHVERDAVLDIELPPVSLSGSVLADLAGQAVAGARVSLARTDDGDSQVGTTSASDGSFRFDGLAVGDYRVRAFHRDYGDTSRSLYIGGSETVELRMQRDAGKGAPNQGGRWRD